MKQTKLISILNRSTQCVSTMQHIHMSIVRVCFCSAHRSIIFSSTHAIKISLSNLMAYHNICLRFVCACVWILCSSVKSKSLFNMHDHKRVYAILYVFLGIKMSISIHVPNIFICKLLIRMPMPFFSGENKTPDSECEHELSKEHFSRWIKARAPCVNIL